MTTALLAPAKLTLSLRVLGARADGFHELEALTVSVSEPHDIVTLEDRADGVTLRVTGATEGVPEDEQNLAVQAAREAGRAVAIGLHKGIPPDAGLGGGSSDAAAVLRGLGAERFAAELGSDVPFCVRGGAAWVRGRGEVLEPVSMPGSLAVVIAVPAFGLRTPAVYRAWDELGGPRARREVATPAPVAHLLDRLANDLEPAAEHVEARLVGFRQEVEAHVGVPALLAGSGSAYAVVLAGDEAARAGEAAARLRAVGIRAWSGRAPAAP